MTTQVLFRVWRDDGRWKLVTAENERQAMRKVRRATKAVLVEQRKAVTA